ncbi:MAG TPA: hypothetical protein VFH27_01525 [Longimicrobiaceae bacterium]|nr:hypothetical protein [Longimicrobiaceae bacterium]
MNEQTNLPLHHQSEPDSAVDALRRDIQIGIDELDRGNWVDGEEAFERVLRRIASVGEDAG